MMDLSIILVNYKSPGLLIDCLESVYRETNRYKYEIIVVDNDSQDDSKSRVTALYPQVQWLQMEYNSGFARANNAGIAIARGRNILLLNTDTIIQNGALDMAMDLFEQHKEYVACGVQLLNTDGTHQISGAHVMTGGLNTVLPLPYLGRFVRYWGYKLKAKIPSVTSVSAITDVDWIVGAFVMVRKEVLAKSGLLDPDFFMYAEEIEWCARLKKQGRLCLFEAPQVIHIGGGTSSGFYNAEEWNNGKNLWNRRGRQIIISNQLRIYKEFGTAWFLILTCCYIADIPVFFVGLLIEKLLKGGKAMYSWRNFVEYVKNIGVLLRYFPKMLSNKPFFYKVS